MSSVACTIAPARMLLAERSWGEMERKLKQTRPTKDLDSEKHSEEMQSRMVERVEEC